MERIGNPEAAAQDRPARARAPQRTLSHLVDFTRTCASNMNSKPHVGRQRSAPPRFLSMTDGFGAIARRHCPVGLSTRASHARLRLSSSLRVSASLACTTVVGASAPEEVESAVRLAPIIMLGETIPADVPDALTRRNRKLSPSARHSYGGRR